MRFLTAHVEGSWVETQPKKSLARSSRQPSLAIGHPPSGFFCYAAIRRCEPARAADPWHLPGWSVRAVVEVARGQAGPDADTAGVRILGQGRGKDDGADFRVLDAGGKPVPFQVAFHDASAGTR